MKTIPNLPELSGSIVLERGTHFLSKQIIMHNWILAKLTDRKPAPWSHAEMLLWSKEEHDIELTDNKGKKRIFHLKANTLYTIGARASGPDISPVAEYYGKNEIKIRRPKVALSSFENTVLWITFKYLDPARYQVGNFMAWITDFKILALLPFLKPEKKEQLLEKLWLGTEKDNKFYCYRFVAVMAKAIWLWNKDTKRVSIYDLLEAKGFEDYELSEANN